MKSKWNEFHDRFCDWSVESDDSPPASTPLEVLADLLAAGVAAAAIILLILYGSAAYQAFSTFFEHFR